jgi:hypothetical protein
MRKGKALSLALGIATLVAEAGLLQAQTTNSYVTGNISWLETWKSGNVAFTLTATTPCNGQFILNKSDPGFKNQYTMLVAAKLADRPVRVYLGSCIAAEGGGGNYAEVVYLYYD